MKNAAKTNSATLGRISPLAGISPLNSRRKNTANEIAANVPFGRNFLKNIKDINTAKPSPPTGGYTRWPYLSPRGGRHERHRRGHRQPMPGMPREAMYLKACGRMVYPRRKLLPI